MKIGKKFNQLKYSEYVHVIENNKKYIDFNTLGLYRSIVETEKLSLAEKLEIINIANKMFGKTFDFLQLKDPYTYFKLITLGQTITPADENQLWDTIRKNQMQILKNKKIKHRNFGEYSKHNCGYETCPYNGIMIKQGSFLMESNMHFDTDKSNYGKKEKSFRNKRERKSKHYLIETE